MHREELSRLYPEEVRIFEERLPFYGGALSKGVQKKAQGIIERALESGELPKYAEVINGENEFLPKKVAIMVNGKCSYVTLTSTYKGARVPGKIPLEWDIGRVDEAGRVYARASLQCPFWSETEKGKFSFSYQEETVNRDRESILQNLGLKEYLPLAEEMDDVGIGIELKKLLQQPGLLFLPKKGWRFQLVTKEEMAQVIATIQGIQAEMWEAYAEALGHEDPSPASDATSPNSSSNPNSIPPAASRQPNLRNFGV